MPSWSPSEREDEEQEAPPDAVRAVEVEAARRVLAELFEADGDDDPPPVPGH